MALLFGGYTLAKNSMLISNQPHIADSVEAWEAHVRPGSDRLVVIMYKGDNILCVYNIIELKGFVIELIN